MNKLYDKTGHPDLTKHLENDADYLRKTFELMGVKETDTLWLRDSGYDNLEEKMLEEVQLKYVKARKNRTNTLFFIWYGGHGSFYKTTTYVNLNEEDPKKRYYPLEMNINQWSKNSYTYTFLIMDSCRKILDESEQELLRGGSASDFDEVMGQIKIIFSCQPGDVTDASSTLASLVFEDIQRQI